MQTRPAHSTKTQAALHGTQAEQSRRGNRETPSTKATNRATVVTSPPTWCWSRKGWRMRRAEETVGSAEVLMAAARFRSRRRCRLLGIVLA